MPIIIDPNLAPAAPVETVSSPDNILTASSRPDLGGVLLRVDFNPNDTPTYTEDFTGSTVPDGWAPHGPVTLADAGGKLQITETGAASSGADWALPSPLPAGKIKATYTWTSAEPLDATDFRVNLVGPDDTSVTAMDTPARGGLGGTWTVIGNSNKTIPVVQFYLLGHTDGNRVFTLDNVSVGPALPEKVRIYRADGSVVRGADPAYCPGGQAVVFDAEASTEKTNVYYAVPIYDDGEDASMASESVALDLPFGDPLMDIWLKSVEDPNLSLLLPGTARQRTDSTMRNTLQLQPNGRRWFGSTQAPSERPWTLTLRTLGRDQEDAMDALLSSGVLLMQQASAVGGYSDYVIPTAISVTEVDTYTHADLAWTVTLTQVDRPPTIDSEVRVPGKSYGDNTGTYADRLNWYPLYEDRI